MDTKILTQSEQLFAAAQRYIPGGVNSPVRAFKAVGGTPIFFERANGAYLFSEDGEIYIDYIGSWGPMILGHNHPNVVKAIQETAECFLSLGAPCALETQLAEKICALMPNIEKIRFVNSGTEATMSAIRLARGYTKRDKIIKFEGCYHGHSDSLLVKAGSGALTLGVPSSPGVPQELTQHTLIATFNNLDSVAQLFLKYPNQIAAIIIEPVAGNMNCVLPQAEFLKGLRELCDRYNALLIFDEVMTGFRVALNGAQGFYKIKPDLTTLGKIIGGGLPVGAFGGRKEIMDQIAPLGPIYQAGTLSGNPLAMASGLATLNEITNPGFYAALEKQTASLLRGLTECAAAANIPFTTNQLGSMFGLFFSREPIQNFEQVLACNIDLFNQFFHSMLQQKIYLAPSAYEAGFVSAAHTNADIENTISAAEKAFANF